MAERPPTGVPLPGAGDPESLPGAGIDADLAALSDDQVQNELRELNRLINQRTHCQETTRRMLELEWDRRLKAKAARQDTLR